MRWKLKINSLFLLLWQKLHSSKFPGTKELLISSCTLYSYCFGQTEPVHPIPVNTMSRTFSTRKFDLKTGNSKGKYVTFSGQNVHWIWPSQHVCNLFTNMIDNDCIYKSPFLQSKMYSGHCIGHKHKESHGPCSVPPYLDKALPNLIKLLASPFYDFRSS